MQPFFANSRHLSPVVCQHMRHALSRHSQRRQAARPGRDRNFDGGSLADCDASSRAR